MAFCCLFSKSSVSLLQQAWFKWDENKIRLPIDFPNHIKALLICFLGARQRGVHELWRDTCMKKHKNPEAKSGSLFTQYLKIMSAQSKKKRIQLQSSSNPSKTRDHQEIAIVLTSRKSKAPLDFRSDQNKCKFTWTPSLPTMNACLPNSSRYPAIVALRIFDIIENLTSKGESSLLHKVKDHEDNEDK